MLYHLTDGSPSPVFIQNSTGTSLSRTGIWFYVGSMYDVDYVADAFWRCLTVFDRQLCGDQKSGGHRPCSDCLQMQCRSIYLPRSVSRELRLPYT